MSKLQLLLFFCLFSTIFCYAQNYTISGYITVHKSGETVINSTIIDINTGKGTVSNSYGFYSLTLPKGEVILKYSYVGFTLQTHNIVLTRDTIINIKLSENTELNEVLIFLFLKLKTFQVF